MGGGLECVLVCDICIVEVYVKLVVFEMVVGLFCCGCGMQMLLWFVGEGWVKCMILIGECVDVQIVLCIGLVEEVVEIGVVCEVVIVMVLCVIMLSLQVVIFSKQFIYQVCNGVLCSVVLVVECECFVDLFDYLD